MKKNSDKTELRQWMDEQYRTSPGLKERVEGLVEEMSIEQGAGEDSSRKERADRASEADETEAG